METIKLGTYSIHISPNIDTVMDISNKKLLLCHKSALNTIGLLTYNEQTDTIKLTVDGLATLKCMKRTLQSCRQKD